MIGHCSSHAVNRFVFYFSCTDHRHTAAILSSADCYSPSLLAVRHLFDSVTSPTTSAFSSVIRQHATAAHLLALTNQLTVAAERCHAPANGIDTSGQLAATEYFRQQFGNGTTDNILCPSISGSSKLSSALGGAKSRFHPYLSSERR